jgi:diacylglycerol kinase (ATP)
MKHQTYILNPYAGRGSAQKLVEPLTKALRERGVPHDVVLTTRPGEASEIARSARGEIVVAVGGDGTVNEVANGVIETGRTLGVIPAGNGNDFVKNIGSGPGIPQAIDRISQGTVKLIDVGTVECLVGEGSSGSADPRRYFVNGVGIGFDAAVAAKTREIKHLTGVLLYLAAVFQMLGKYRAPLFNIEFDGGEARASKHLLIAIGNGICAGGGFYLTPNAKVDDGFFDACLIDDIPVRTILHLIPKAMLGKHTSSPLAKFLHFKKMDLTADCDFYVHADGEMVGRNVRQVRIALLPKALPVITG